jgi:ribosomal protein S18 acetylase RimI-like enzyme
MIEVALEKYPLRAELKGGIQALVRPAETGDQAAYEEFLKGVPEDERMFVQYRFLDGPVFHKGFEKLDFEENLPLLVLADGKIVADASLHQRQGGWKRHIGLVSLLTHKDYKNLGLADLLINELFVIAEHCGLSKLEAEFNGERDVAIKAFATCGFRELARVPNYVEDTKAQLHDYVLMGVDVTAPEEYMMAGD